MFEKLLATAVLTTTSQCTILCFNVFPLWPQMDFDRFSSPPVLSMVLAGLCFLPLVWKLLANGLLMLGCRFPAFSSIAKERQQRAVIDFLKGSVYLAVCVALIPVTVLKFKLWTKNGFWDLIPANSVDFSRLAILPVPAYHFFELMYAWESSPMTWIHHCTWIVIFLNFCLSIFANNKTDAIFLINSATLVTQIYTLNFIFHFGYFAVRLVESARRKYLIMRILSLTFIATALGGQGMLWTVIIANIGNISGMKPLAFSVITGTALGAEHAFRFWAAHSLALKYSDEAIYGIDECVC